ncbi:MAG TPA: hypothetical protein VKT77_16635 [Chthonomonadaceae bacterium]|nr:hypothetical protein [Chthonomonadaceae bacterium]
MPAFEMLYDDEEDALEVTFATFDESFARTIPLNDQIVIYTDLSMRVAWGITFYSYARLLEVSETYLDRLAPLPKEAAAPLLAVLFEPPLSAFLEPVDPDRLLARVKAPSIADLV